MIPQIIVELYLRAATLASLERKMDGYSDSSEWPFSHYDAIMQAADDYYDLLEEAIDIFGEEEVNRYYDYFVAKLDIC